MKFLTKLFKQSVKPTTQPKLFKLNPRFNQKFSSQFQPEWAIGSTIYFIGNEYQKPKQIMNAQIDGYKYIFTIDEHANIVCEFEYTYTGEHKYYVPSSSESLWFLTKFQAEKHLETLSV